MKSRAAQNHWLGERLLDRSAFLTTHPTDRRNRPGAGDGDNFVEVITGTPASTVAQFAAANREAFAAAA